jgi:leucyl aminopeptidase
VTLDLPQCSPVRLTPQPLLDVEADVVLVTAGQDAEGELLLDVPVDGLRDQLLALGFTGAWATRQLVTRPGQSALLVVGTGRAVDLPGVTLREPRHALAGALATLTSGRVGVSLGGAWDPLLVEAVVLGTYRFDRYAKRPRPTELVLAEAPDGVDDELAEAQSRLESVCFARDWVSTPAGDKRPAVSADLLVAEAERSGVEVRVWSTEELQEAGCGGILGVGQGSQQPARIVQLTARGTSDAPPLVLVGKGLTYDAGGQNIKTVWLEHMKLDMGGAAAVAGAVLHAGRRPRSRTVIGWLALAENLISSTAYLTGDVLRMHSGLTVEVANTDAEGRLALADAMSLADAGEAAAVLTVATLTGAAINALGPRTAAVMAFDEGLAATFAQAAESAGESVWRMPVLPHFGDSLKSHVADTTNLGSMQGQPMVAATFLKRFAPDGVPFAHFDLAGPAFNMGEPYDGVPAGGTGYGVRTLVELLDRL